MIAIIGRLTNAALGWALPGLSALPLYLLAGTLAISLAASVAFFKGSEGKAAAITLERASCEIGKAEDAAASDRMLAQLLTEINAHQPEDGDDRKTSVDLCKGSPFCRDAKPNQPGSRSGKVVIK